MIKVKMKRMVKPIRQILKCCFHVSNHEYVALSCLFDIGRLHAYREIGILETNFLLDLVGNLGLSAQIFSPWPIP